RRASHRGHWPLGTGVPLPRWYAAGGQSATEPCGAPPCPTSIGGPPMSDTNRVGERDLSTYRDVQLSPDFAELRRKFRRFAFPMAAVFLAWYFLYVLLAAYATDFMSTKVFGNINVALLFGLGQFLSTFIITMVY